jgi:exodeoxyribonuclease-3
MGLRIDLLMATQALVQRATFCLVDRTARKGTKPSDHAPVFVDIED